MKRMKKLLAAILAAVMVAGLLPAGALAAEGETEAVPELQEIGVRIGEDYVAAVPEEDGITLFSLLPLTEKRFTLDLTGYFPEELKAVTLETVIGGLTPEGAETGTSKYAVWAKQLYYDEEGNRVEDSDDFTVLNEPKTLDLSSRYENCRLELIVGTVDQLNPDNIRYIVQVYTQGLDDMLDFDASTLNGEKIAIYQSYYQESRIDSNYYWLTAAPEHFPNGECRLAFGFSDKWRARDWSEVKVYQGYYESETVLPADPALAKDITDMVWSKGINAPAGFQADYRSSRNVPEFTLVLKKEGTTLVIPFGVYMYAGNISISGDSDAVAFALAGGKLPDGVELKPNGELYGVPSKAGTYTFTLDATYTETVGGEIYTQTDSREFTITITDNTDRNVWDYDGSLFNDGAYAIETAIPNENDTTNIFGSATQGDNRWSNPTQVLYSKGDYGTFVSRVFLDKQELTEGTDYTSESGSTRITLNTSTLKSKGNGTHTISAEFRVGGENGTLRRAAQNYTLTTLGTNSSGNQGSGSQGSGSGGSSGGSTSYTVSAPSSTSNGAVNVSPSSAKKGSSVTITVMPDDGYKLEKLTVTDSKGNPIKVTEQGDGKFTFVMPGSKVNVDAVFVKTTDTTVAGFSDVNPSAYYADAVTWAVEKGITVGTGDDTFSPNSPCTRAQIVTFLWRAAGSPIVEETSIFDDIAPDSFYYNAVQWAVAQGITVGTGGNTFSPDATCTRAQAVTFLYSYEQSPAVSGSNTFTDVAGGAYYTDAVQWAVDKGVTVGTSSTTFSPNATCTRSQIVTFLYRDMA